MKVLEITLRLGSITHLFEEPETDPFSEYFLPHSSKVGMDYIASELYVYPAARRIRLTVLLPAEQVTPGLEQKTLQAIQRYSDAWAQEARQEMSKSWYIGSRTGLLAVVALFVLIGSALKLVDSPNFFIGLLGEGLYVAGWVTLWFPIETLLFELWGNWLERRVYQSLKDIQITILPESALDGEPQRQNFSRLVEIS